MNFVHATLTLFLLAAGRIFIYQILSYLNLYG